MTLAEIWGIIGKPLTDLATWGFKRLQRPDPVAVLKRRQQLRDEFESNLPERNKYGVHCDAIIRDIRRMDNYPNSDEHGKGISPWFKVEIKGLYHRGVEAFLSMPRAIKPLVTGGWTFAHHEDPDRVIAYPVGRIPYDLIEYVDWRGDGYYPDPHIYCRFKDGQPYEKIVYYRKYHPDDQLLIEVEDFNPYEKKKWWQRIRSS